MSVNRHNGWVGKPIEILCGLKFYIQNCFLMMQMHNLAKAKGIKEREVKVAKERNSQLNKKMGIDKELNKTTAKALQILFLCIPVDEVIQSKK